MVVVTVAVVVTVGVAVVVVVAVAVVVSVTVVVTVGVAVAVVVAVVVGVSKFPDSYVDEEYREFVRHQPCALSGEVDGYGEAHECSGPINPCHLKNVGSGGLDAGNLYPGCQYGLHRLEEDKGWEVVYGRYGINLWQVAVLLYHKFLLKSGRVESKLFVR